MNSYLKQLIDIAANEVGVTEGNKDNTGTRVVEYQGASWLAPGAWPWCAAFTCWVMREWLEDEKVRDALKIGTFSQAEKWRCRDASAFGWDKWAAGKSTVHQIPPVQLALAGDFVVYEFSHIGLVIEDQKSISGKIRTIEGNTHGQKDKDSEPVDGVWRKERSPTLVKNYIRLFSEL
ncbi:CHAP domain-containing protein [Rahnella laticis]|uniref:CHAP domain-containing protein n=1 Tax=Rahnella laticis TaxID=2787622 RepID=UPI0018A28A76|nr:CHAP domain-containing protein [Rahnella laticis]MBF7995702.1 CHAP domain-containing protein [Rahnella laticis]